MFKVEFYDDFIRYLFSSWWMYLFLGLDFILLGILILLFPQLLAWLVAIFLLLNGVVLLGIAWSVWRIRHQYGKWKKKYHIPVQ